jgi:hypothetical protein
MLILLNKFNLLLLIFITFNNYYYDNINIINIIDIIFSSRLFLVLDFNDNLINLYLILIFHILEILNIHENIIISILSYFLNFCRSIILYQLLNKCKNNKKSNIYKLNLLDNNSNIEIECSICLDIINKKYCITFCNHKFHNKCIYKWLRIKNTCPICRKIIKSNID